MRARKNVNKRLWKPPDFPVRATTRCSVTGGPALPVGRLETRCAVGENERIANAGRVLALDGSRLVHDALVIEQQGRERLMHRKTHATLASRFEHSRFTAANAATRDQHERHEVHTITMRALRRRATDAIARVDAELVSLDVPAARGTDACEELAETGNQAEKRGCACHALLDWLEHAFDAAVQGVIARRLPVRPVRSQIQRRR